MDMLFDIWKDSIAHHASDEDIFFKIVRINENIPMLSSLDVLKYYANLILSDENTIVNFWGILFIYCKLKRC